MLHKKCLKCGKSIPSESVYCMYCAQPVEERQLLRIEKILNSLKKEKPTEKILFKLSEEFNRNWEEIRQNRFLTYFIIDVIKEIRNPTFPSYIVNRAAGDSRSGGIFEDVFAQLIERYFQADIEFWTPEKEFILKVKVNKPIAVPNERNKKKPDILIRHKSKKEPLVLLELKTSFTKRSLLKTYNELEEMYKRISPKLEYFFIIFNASQQKAKTYKKISPNCRVLCYDFKVDRDSLIKQIQPKIIDPLEQLFEDIKSVIKNRIKNYQ